ncbi:hypothetical protein [Actinospica robiniae]|uniref:hypothetical protein n=1 Tax=Actinospica robiniae TaxID=304901 RepID=UPI0006871AA1|nr:hypothetical protein [Actinospica robiniae]
MTTTMPSTGRPQRRGRPAPGRARCVRRVLGVFATVALAALIAAPAAQAAAPAGGDSGSAQRVILADPAPSPTPSPSTPGIGLGPGSPTSPSTTPSPVTTTDPGTGTSSNPSWFDVPGQITKAINDWFGSLIADALTPMLDLLGSTLLGTPDVTAMAGVQRLWTQMALLANALYLLLVLIGAVIVTTHGTVQSRHSAKEIVPRLAVGMIAGNASIALLALMIHLADAIASALLGGTIDPATAGKALGNLLGGSAGNSIFLILLDLGAQVMLIAILLTYIVRVALTVILAVAAPLVLMLHAIPGPDTLARMWWRAIGGLFLIQLGQSLVFVVALDVMLDPTANVSLFGLPNNSALVDTLVFLALCWILIKIPMWVSRSMLGGAGSGVARMAKAVIAYKTLGALGMRKGPGGFPVRKPGRAPNRPRPSGPSGPGGGGGGPRRPGPAPGASGGGSGVIYRATQLHPDAPAARSAGAIATIRPGLPASSRAPAGQGPRLALETGSASGSPKLGAPGTPPAPGPGTGYRQMTLPIKTARVPHPKPPAAAHTADPRSAPAPTDRLRPRQVQRGLFPPPPKPSTPARAAPPKPGPEPASAPPARMSAARTQPAPPSRPTPSPNPAASSSARMSAPPPVRGPAAPQPPHRPTRAPAPRSTKETP